MSKAGEDEALDELLGRALALSGRAADAAFVSRVDAAVAEAERYRRLRARLRGQLVGELLALAGLAGGIAVIAHAPGVADTLTRAPALLWPAMLALLLLWMLFTRTTPRLLA
jgi:hypothetical protein